MDLNWHCDTVYNIWVFKKKKKLSPNLSLEILSHNTDLHPYAKEVSLLSGSAADENVIYEENQKNNFLEILLLTV